MGVSTLGQVKTQIALIKQQQAGLVDLSRQLATGRKADTFSGLGSDALPLQRAQADLALLDRYMNNITLADTRLSLMSNAVGEFKAQSENFSSELLLFGMEGTHQAGEPVYDPSSDTPRIVGYTSGDPDRAFKNLQAAAESMFGILEGLLNAKDSSRYLFSGDQATTKPFGESSALDAAVSSLITDWKNGDLGTGELIDALAGRDASTDPNAITDATLGYDPALGNAGAVRFRPDEGQEIEYTTLATEDGFRDVMVALAYFKSAELGPIVDEVDPDTMTVTTSGAPGLTVEEMQGHFYRVFEAVAQMVEGAISDLGAMDQSLQTTRARVNDFAEQHAVDQTVLENISGAIEAADINEVATQLQTLNTQLSVSYSVTALIQQNSLVNFI